MNIHKKLLLAFLAIFATSTLIEGWRGRWHGRGWGHHRGYWGRGWGRGWGWGVPTVGLAIGAAAASDRYDDDYYERRSYKDDKGRRYWTVKNMTGQAILVKTPGRGYKRIAPGKSRNINRGRSFKLKVKNQDNRMASFTTEEHYVTINSDVFNEGYFGDDE